MNLYLFDPRVDLFIALSLALYWGCFIDLPFQSFSSLKRFSKLRTIFLLILTGFWLLTLHLGWARVWASGPEISLIYLSILGHNLFFISEDGSKLWQPVHLRTLLFMLGLVFLKYLGSTSEHWLFIIGLILTLGAIVIRAVPVLSGYRRLIFISGLNLIFLINFLEVPYLQRWGIFGAVLVVFLIKQVAESLGRPIRGVLFSVLGLVMVWGFLKISFSDRQDMFYPISFPFFLVRLISYLKSKTEPKRNLKTLIQAWGQYVCYILFVPTFFFGPVLEYDSFIGSLPYSIVEKTIREDFKSKLIYLGRVLLAALKLRLAFDVLPSLPVFILHFEDLSHASFYVILASIYLQLIFLYLLLSGTSDLAIGFSGLLEIVLPENFNYPFTATNPADFWGRWHISFSIWLKRNVYYPLVLYLGGLSLLKRVRSWIGPVGVMTTFVLMGLWHRVSALYLIYGLVQGFAFLLYFCWSSIPQVRFLGRSKVWRFFAIVTFFHFIAVTNLIDNQFLYSSNMEMLRNLFHVLHTRGV